MRAGMYPISASEVYWFTVFNIPPDEVPSTDAEGKADALKSVEGWAYGIQEAIERTPAAEVIRSRLGDRYVFSKWPAVGTVENCILHVSTRLALQHKPTTMLGSLAVLSNQPSEQSTMALVVELCALDRQVTRAAKCELFYDIDAYDVSQVAARAWEGLHHTGRRCCTPHDTQPWPRGLRSSGGA